MFSYPCAFVCQQDDAKKNYRADFYKTWWKDGRWAKKEPIEFWRRSPGRIQEFTFSLSLTSTNLPGKNEWILIDKKKSKEI